MPSYTGKSDSGYGDDGASGSTQDPAQDHPLARKGYEIGSATALQVGDVFEFLWADANEFEWEWKCLGYQRFIVLRHSETFPHHCACIPVSVGGRHNFAKPGIDSSQQGFVFDDGSPDQWYEKLEDRNRLHYPPIGIELKPGRFRVKEDSRANYADIIEVDHDSQVIVIGSVARYFDRVRRNVNKALMRNILKKALSEYRAKKNADSGSVPKIEPSVVGGPTEEDEDKPKGQAETDNREVIAEAVREPSRTPPRQSSPKEPEESREGAPLSSTTKLPQSRGRKKEREPLAPAKTLVASTPAFGKSDYDLRSLHSVAMKGLK